MKLIRHLFGYLPVGLATGFVGLAGVYVFTRLLGAADYGRYALMVSAVALIHTLSLTWVEAAGYRFAGTAEEAGDLPDHYQTGLALSVRSLGITALGTLVLWALLGSDPAYARIIPWLFAIMAVETFNNIALEAHRAHQRIARFSMMATARLVIGFLVGAGLAWIGGFGAAAPFMGLLAAALFVLIREGPWLRKQARGGKTDRVRARAWAAYGIPVAATLVLDILLSVSDRFLIKFFLDEAAVGAYAAGYGVADKPVLLICSWAALAASPIVMAAYEASGKAAAGDAARGMFGAIILVGLPAACGLALVAEPLAGAMIGEDLREQAAQIIPYIAFAGLLNGLLIHYIAESFHLTRQTRQHAMLMAVPAGANIALNLILLPMFGLMGAVYATVASYAIGVLVLGWFGRKLLVLPIPLGEVAKASFASLCMWPVIHFIPELGSWTGLFAKAAAGAVTYTIIVLALDAGGVRAILRQRFIETGSAHS